MAGFQRVSGDFLPLLNEDTGAFVNAGADAIQSNVAIQSQGPILAWFTATADGSLTGADVGKILKTTEQMATIHVFEYYNASNDSVAMAVYPANAWTVSDLEANINAALTTTVTVTASALFTGIQFGPLAPTVPDSVTIGTATELSATSASVEFTPEFDGGSPITVYAATSNPDGITATGSASPIHIGGLTTGTTYSFSVTATNAVGTSAPSAASNDITTP